jgi:signal transduction histidine kinase/CheY-like chemotaxis protein
MKWPGKPNNTRFAILIPVGVVLSLFIVAALASLYHVTSENIVRENRRRLDQMKTVYKETVANEGQILENFLDYFCQEEKYQEAFLSKDREALAALIGPLFDRLQADNQISHFYFVDLDNRCFFRGHNPTHFGQIVRHQTLLHAVLAGETRVGVDLGKMGALTLRVVRPWFRDGELIGYLELGKEIHDVTPRVRSVLELEMAIFVQKRFLNREGWVGGQEVFGFQGSWDQFFDIVMMDGQLSDIHEGMLEPVWIGGEATDAESVFRVDAHGETHLGGVIPLRDVSGTHVGSMVGFWDGTPLVKDQRAIMGFLGLGITLGSTLLLVFLGLYLGKVETRLNEASSALREIIAKQEADATAMIRNDKILQREMERREQAQTELKQQLEELDEARAAALNIMEDSDLARQSAENSNRELAKAMAETERLRQEAVDASLAKSDFLANMSHEIRTPMNGVLGMADLLLTTDLNAQQEDLLSVITTSGHSLLEIINDILDFSKIEAGKMELEVVQFNLWDTVEEVCDTMAIGVQEKGLELITRIHRDVPEIVQGDSGRLRQVLVNLIGNAVKFTHVGEIRVSAEWAETEAGDPILRFGIQDSGIGIPPDREASLFDAFSQADTSTTRRFGGTGLGLSISRRLVTLMNGTIGLKSELGLGSEFWFTAELQPVESSETATGWENGDTHKVGRALVAVANESLGQWMFECLRPYAGELSLAASGPLARELILAPDSGSSPWDLILIDGDLEVELAEEIEHWLQRLPEDQRPRVILLSPISAGTSQEEAERIGFAGVLNKPVHVRALLEVVLPDNPVEPAGIESDPESVPAAECDPVEEPDRSRQKLNVLLVDDNLVNRKVGQGMLKKLGCQTTVAVNGLDAVMVLERLRFDLVFMDIQMPELDGYAATLQIRDPESSVLDHEIPIIAMTANAMEGDRDKCLGAGMDDYISKPVNLVRLQEVIDRVLSGNPEPRKALSELRHPADAGQDTPIAT